MGGLIIFYLLLSLLCAFGGYSLGKERQIGETAGLLIGLFFGVIGIIIILFLPKLPSEEKAESFRSPIVSYERVAEEKNKNYNTADELIKWHELKEKGVISEEEFEVKKRELMR